MDEEKRTCTFCDRQAAWTAKGLAVKPDSLHFCQEHYEVLLRLFELFHSASEAM